MLAGIAVLGGGVPAADLGATIVNFAWSASAALAIGAVLSRALIFTLIVLGPCLALERASNAAGAAP